MLRKSSAGDQRRVSSQRGEKITASEQRAGGLQLDLPHSYNMHPPPTSLCHWQHHAWKQSEGFPSSAERLMTTSSRRQEESTKE
ncbi:hypothetical protein FQA47_021649 [Oryzias melastigma]|uniref:Uncharacterized protein n=1 Tax=Oryzias melastigma TaxID=30732 RepID=A0A834C5T0_ORYME|nr:hypothetical protein FQA47_021649 [Oryzias melastigma]